MAKGHIQKHWKVARIGFSQKQFYQNTNALKFIEKIEAIADFHWRLQFF